MEEKSISNSSKYDEIQNLMEQYKNTKYYIAKLRLQYTDGMTVFIYDRSLPKCCYLRFKYDESDKSIIRPVQKFYPSYRIINRVFLKSVLRHYYILEKIK